MTNSPASAGTARRFLIGSLLAVVIVGLGVLLLPALWIGLILLQIAIGGGGVG